MQVLSERIDRNNVIEFVKLYQNIINNLREENKDVSIIPRYVQSKPEYVSK